MATLEPPYSDSGLDTDGDGLYDYLVVEVPVEVTEAGQFLVLVAVYWDAQGSNTTYLGAGLHVVPVWLPGWRIYNHGLNGPYNAEISLRDAETDTELDSTTFQTTAYSYLDFERPPVSFSPPHSDFGLDADGDGLFDYLVVNASLQVKDTGTYRVSGLLHDPSYDLHIFTFDVTTLEAGLQRVPLWFEGTRINTSDIDGPYTVDLTLFENDTSPFIELDFHTTAPYSYLEFDAPTVSFSPPHSDFGLDNDDDGLFDELVVRISLQVDQRAKVLVTGDLLVASPPVSSKDNVWRILDPGNPTWELHFEGVGIYSLGRDGPYEVEVDLFIEDLGLVDRTIYQTMPYQHTEFRQTSAEFGGADPEATLVDGDGDGRADLLLVDVPLEVRASGDYFLSGVLRTRPLSALASHLVRLDPGNRSITLTYSGITLNRSTSDGPWSVDLNLYRMDGGRYDRDTGSWTTPAYTPSQFEWRPVALVTGSLKETPDGRPVYLGTVTVLDPTTKFLKVAYTDITGQFLLEAYYGTFYVMAMGDYPVSQVERVSFQDGDNLEFLLEAPPPNAVIHDIRFDGWNESQVVTNISLAYGNQTFRAFADLYGDFDGFASDSELSLLLPNTLPPPVGPMPLEIEVDDRSLTRASDEYVGTTGEGEPTSSLPLTMTYESLYRNSTGPEPGPRHNVTIRLRYDTEGLLTSARVALPQGFNGTPIPSANVTVRSVGSGVWEVDPGLAPEGVDPEDLAEVRIEAKAIPEPEEVFDPFLLVLWVAPPVAAVAVMGVVYWLWRRRSRPPATEDEDIQDPLPPSTDGALQT